MNGRDRMFFATLAAFAGLYALLIAAMIAADLTFTSPKHLWRALSSPDVRFSMQLSLLTALLSTLLSMWVGVPAAFLLARGRFTGRRALEFLFDVPVVLPPLVMGLSLLILFQTPPLKAMQRWLPVTYAVPAIVIAQFTVCTALVIQTMKVAIERIDARKEQVALTLGATRAQAFLRVVLPEARGGLVAAASLSFCRALGEFGPILVFAGATRRRTEVLPTTIFLELSVGELESALAVSLLLILLASLVLVVSRHFGEPRDE